MKGNEARVVFFLHPVDQVRDGKVARVEPIMNFLAVASLLVVALLLGLGVLGFLLFPVASTTTTTTTTATTATTLPINAATTPTSMPPTPKGEYISNGKEWRWKWKTSFNSEDGSGDFTDEKEYKEDQTEMVTMTGTTPKGDWKTSFNHDDGLGDWGTYNDDEDYREDQTELVTTTIRGITPQNETSKEPKPWQFYPLVASTILLLAYLTFIVLRYSYSKSKLVQGWTRRLLGKAAKEEKILLHTLPYYLAITRSSCEVSYQVSKMRTFFLFIIESIYINFFPDKFPPNFLFSHIP